jgi:hypothetical protein
MVQIFCKDTDNADIFPIIFLTPSRKLSGWYLKKRNTDKENNNVDVTFLLTTANITENTQDTINNSIFLPISVVVTAVKVIGKYHSLIF